MKRKIFAVFILFTLLILSSCKKNYYDPDNTETVVKSDFEYIKLSETDLTLELGGYVKLDAELSPESDKAIAFSSSDSKVAAVDNSGNIAAISPGKVVITAQTDDGIKAECQVEVNGLRRMIITQEVPATAKDGESFKVSVKFENCAYPTVKIIPDCKGGKLTSEKETVSFDGTEQLFSVGDSEISFVVDGSQEINSIRIVGFDKGEMIDAKEITIYPPLPDYEALKTRIDALEKQVTGLEASVSSLEETITGLED